MAISLEEIREAFLGLSCMWRGDWKEGWELLIHIAGQGKVWKNKNRQTVLVAKCTSR